MLRKSIEASQRRVEAGPYTHGVQGRAAGLLCGLPREEKLLMVGDTNNTK